MIDSIPSVHKGIGVSPGEYSGYDTAIPECDVIASNKKGKIRDRNIPNGMLAWNVMDGVLRPVVFRLDKSSDGTFYSFADEKGKVYRGVTGAKYFDRESASDQARSQLTAIIERAKSLLAKL